MLNEMQQAYVQSIRTILHTNRFLNMRNMTVTLQHMATLFEYIKLSMGKMESKLLVDTLIF